jgi:uncharacterized protein YjbI with pentapeptide repeats
MLFHRSGKNFQGHSFRGQNLTGADFSNADIRGADFSDAILIGANFCHAQAGLQPWHQIQHTLLTWLLAGLSGFTSTVVLIFAGYLLFPYSLQPDQVLAPLVVLGLGGILAMAIVQRGLGFAFGTAIVAGMGLGALLGSITGSLNGMAAGAIAITATTTVSLGVIWVCAILLTTTRLIAGKLAVWFAAGMIMMGGAMGANIGIHVALAAAQVIAIEGVMGQKIEAMGEGVTAATLGCAAAVSLSSYVSWRARQGDQKFAGIWQWAIAFTTLGGTRFQGANLTQADFSQAHLKSTDFRNANLTRTNFHFARQLHQAMVKHTILADPAVQNLVVTHRGQHQSYYGRNLKGAHLAGADLSGADLTEADLSEATLVGAGLDQANLTKVHAIATNLQQARLTGACIEAWNIDSTTQLEEVVCDYLYLRYPQQERRPSSGTFAPGDFAALFQEIIHTLDLIFRNGIDQQAFNYSLHQLQVENEGMALAIRSLEKKPNGTVIVRVDVPATVDKAALHADFSHSYELALSAIADQYQGLLQAKDDQLALYQKQQADWQVVLQLLKSQVADPSPNAAPAVGAKLVVLQIGSGSLQTGFPVTLQISTDQQPALQFTQGRLAPVADLCSLYEQWRSTYRQCLKTSFRLDVPDTQITNVSRQDLFQDCYATATRLEAHLNDWLNALAFRPIKDRMLEQLAPTETIQIVVQTADRHLRRLPFQLWDLLHRYPQAEIALSLPDYERVEPVRSPHSSVNILAILGDSTGIDLQNDRALLTQLPNTVVTCLVEPQRQALNDHLWQQSWDILFFAGHSSTPGDSDRGYLQINPQERLTIAQLKHGLRKAIAQGLKLAIFNSCDGLGLARELSDLHIPHLIVMREPVPDYVAQEFLKNFLAGFSSGKSLHQAVREAREKLQGLEDRFPCATWLPIICQNPTEPPLTWEHWQR